MSYGAIENLSLELTTPTNSTVSSELSFEDVPQMNVEMPPAGALKEHKSFYIRDDMVRIQVTDRRMLRLFELNPRQIEDTLFRIPSHFLTQPSVCLAEFFKDKDLSGIVLISDSDISSSAFANFLSVLQVRPTYVIFWVCACLVF
jgi:hypothetical protein